MVDDEVELVPDECDSLICDDTRAERVLRAQVIVTVIMGESDEVLVVHEVREHD